MAEAIIQHRFFKTTDGAQLHYLEAGGGEVLFLLPGAGISADIFEMQMNAFSSHYRVIALDKRGHGKSERVTYGYRVSRFAKDLNDLISGLKLEKVNLLGHSLGASMIYSYIDLFGTSHIRTLIVVDEPPALLINPAWSQQECKQYGAIYQAAELHQLTNQFATTDNGKLNQLIIEKMTTKNITEKQKEQILKCMQIEGNAAAQLYFNNISQDFRDVMRKIDVPTLFITGKESLHPWESHKWMHEQVAGSQLILFEGGEGGNHFPFVENHEKFNAIVSTFLTQHCKMPH